VTGLSGSGPAYLYRFVEALSEAGTKMGLKASVAQRLALKTVLGSALTLHQTGKTPSELIPLVTSKKGTTLAGLKILDRKRFNQTIHQTVRAATERARQILKELRKD
jgi:pyrroline-5-carboxylate reductase